MADLAGEDKPKRTRVFVNHVDLYTGKNISKVRNSENSLLKDDRKQTARKQSDIFFASFLKHNVTTSIILVN